MQILTPAFAGGTFAGSRTVSVDLTGANALILRVVSAGVVTPGGTPILSAVIDPTGVNLAMTGDTEVSAYTNGLERTFTYVGTLPSGVVDVVVTLDDALDKPQVWAQPVGGVQSIGARVRTAGGGVNATASGVASAAGATLLSMSASNNYSNANTITPTAPTVLERRVLTTDGGGSMSMAGAIASTPCSGSSTNVVLVGSSTFGAWSMYTWLLTPAPELGGNVSLDDAAPGGGLSSLGPSTLGGNVTADDATPGGGLSSINSSLGGNVTLADAAPAGTLGAVPGTFTSEALKDWTGTVQAGVALTWFRLYNPSTGALVLEKTGLSTNGSGVVSFSDGAITAATNYAADWLTATGARRMPIKAAA